MTRGVPYYRRRGGLLNTGLLENPLHLGAQNTHSPPSYGRGIELLVNILALEKKTNLRAVLLNQSCLSF
jgi:hypothetical protein